MADDQVAATFPVALNATFASLNDTPRSEIIASRIKDAILAEVLQDGERLPSEAELSAHYGVALETAREALMALRGEGVIHTRRGRHGGSFVSFSEQQAADALSARVAAMSRFDIVDLGHRVAAVSAHVAWLAADRLTGTDLQWLREISGSINWDQPRSVRAGDSYLRIELAALTQSALLTRSEITNQTTDGPILRLGFEQSGFRQLVQAHHDALLRCLTARDAPRAHVAVIEHVEAMALQTLAVRSGHTA